MSIETFVINPTATEETVQTLAKDTTVKGISDKVATEGTVQTLAKEETLQTLAKESTVQTLAKEETLQLISSEISGFRKFRELKKYTGGIPSSGYYILPKGSMIKDTEDNIEYLCLTDCCVHFILTWFNFSGKFCKKTGQVTTPVLEEISGFVYDRDRVNYVEFYF